MPIICGLSLPLATLPTMVGCSCNNGETKPTKEMPKVVFDNDQFIKRGSIKESENSTRVTMIGLCSAGINASDLDENVTVSLIQCSESFTPVLTAKIIKVEQRWITIEVTCTNVTGPCVIYYNMSFKSKTKQEVYEADTPFILYPVDIQEEINDDNVEETQSGIASIAGQTCSVVIEGFTVNGGNEGVVVQPKVVGTSTVEIKSWTVVRGTGSNFSVRIEFDNITENANIKFQLAFTDVTNPNWEGNTLDKVYNFTFAKPTDYLVNDPEDVNYKTETSWTSMGDNDGAKNDINCLFSGFTLVSDKASMINSVTVTSTVNATWTARLVQQNDYYDVYVYGQNIPITAEAITLDFTFSVTPIEGGDPHIEKHTGFKIVIDSNFSIVNFPSSEEEEVVPGVYCFKVWDKSNTETMKLSYSSQSVKSSLNFVGHVLYAGIDCNPNNQISIYVVEEDKFFVGPEGESENFDRTYFAKNPYKGLGIELINQNYESQHWGTDEPGKGIYYLK